MHDRPSKQPPTYIHQVACWYLRLAWVNITGDSDSLKLSGTYKTVFL